jgi:hypothetical protein
MEYSYFFRINSLPIISPVGGGFADHNGRTAKP